MYYKKNIWQFCYIDFAKLDIFFDINKVLAKKMLTG